MKVKLNTVDDTAELIGKLLRDDDLADLVHLTSRLSGVLRYLHYEYAGVNDGIKNPSQQKRAQELTRVYRVVGDEAGEPTRYDVRVRPKNYEDQQALQVALELERLRKRNEFSEFCKQVDAQIKYKERRVGNRVTYEIDNIQSVRFEVDRVISLIQARLSRRLELAGGRPRNPVGGLPISGGVSSELTHGWVDFRLFEPGPERTLLTRLCALAGCCGVPYGEYWARFRVLRCTRDAEDLICAWLADSVGLYLCQGSKAGSVALRAIKSLS